MDIAPGKKGEGSSMRGEEASEKDLSERTGSNVPFPERLTGCRSFLVVTIPAKCP
jgi:hypothetical protein